MSSETSSESLSLFYSFRVGLKVTKMSKDFKMRTFSHCNLLTNFDGLARLAQLPRQPVTPAVIFGLLCSEARAR